MTTFTAAVVQAAPVAFDTGATLAKLERLTADAGAQGAELVLFPEAFVSAYPRGLDYGVKVGSRTKAGREEFARYHASAIEVPGPAVDRMGAAAAKHRVHLVVGVIERDGGTLYCTVVFLGPDGAYLGKHRKLMPTAAERLVWGFGDGSTLPVIDTGVGKLGAVICWENYMPLLRTAMYAKGVQVYCAPTADGRPTWVPTMQHVAMEGRCFVLSCNQFARRADYPDDYPIEGVTSPDEVLSPGGSCIIDPLGNILAGPNYEDECVLTARIDLDQIAEGKFDFDVTGHYARPDVFRLHVNEAASPPVVFGEEPHDAV